MIILTNIPKYISHWETKICVYLSTSFNVFMITKATFFTPKSVSISIHYWIHFIKTSFSSSFIILFSFCFCYSFRKSNHLLCVFWLIIIVQMALFNKCPFLTKCFQMLCQLAVKRNDHFHDQYFSLSTIT